MDDFLLLIDSLMKVALVVCVMVLVATAPSSASAAGHGHEGARQFAGMVGASSAHRHDGGSMHYAFEDDDNFDEHSALNQTNGMSAVAHQHEADHWRHDSDHESQRSTLIEFDPFEHSFNIDGTPMVGCCDINGNAYGITESHFEDSRGGGMSSMFD